MFTTLIDVRTLAEHLGDPGVVIVDCRFRLDDPSWGRAAYADRHIPGAVYADLDRDLSGVKTGANGRHPLPDVDALADTFGRLGIDHRAQVVSYDQDTGMFASRLWWLLRWLGHDAAAVLDGGFAAWNAAGHPTAMGVEGRTVRRFEPMPRPDAFVTVEKVAASVAAGTGRLLDARAPERFRGEVEPIDRAAGHIPGARNYFFKSSVGPDGRFLPVPALRAQLERALDGATPAETISYCGSGVTACHTLLALEHAGLPGAKLYPGSWSEWSSDPQRSVEKGG